MRQVSRRVVAAHRMLRPLAAARQVAPERLHTLSAAAIEENDALEWMKLRAVDAVKPFATRNHDRLLRAASVFTGKKIIGVGLEVIVAHDGGHLNPYPVSKFATQVTGDPRHWKDKLARRQDIAHKRMGDYLVDTKYSLGTLGAGENPRFVIMTQPLLDIQGDGHSDARVADQRGDFRERAEALARDKGFYFDLVPGHDNLVVHEEGEGPRLALVDTVIMSVNDTVRPFVPFAPDPTEWASWLHNVKA